MSVVYGKDTPKLGFGLMRLPRRGFAINVEQVKVMVDLFLDAGFTYFDTAFVYPGSETAIRKALVERHPRDTYTLATKLNARIAATLIPVWKEQAPAILIITCFMRCRKTTSSDMTNFICGILWTSRRKKA